MIQHEFLQRVALTLEVSLRMVKDWILELSPENQEQREKLEQHIEEINTVLVELAEVTRTAHSKYQEEQAASKAMALLEDIQEDLEA